MCGERSILGQGRVGRRLVRAWERGGDGGSGLHSFLTSVLSLKGLHRGTRFCTSIRTSSDLNSLLDRLGLNTLRIAPQNNVVAVLVPLYCGRGSPVGIGQYVLSSHSGEGNLGKRTRVSILEEHAFPTVQGDEENML